MITGSILAQPVEVALDASDLFHATTKVVEGEDGSKRRWLIAAGLVVLPGTVAGKRMFDIDGRWVDEAAVFRAIDTRKFDDLLGAPSSAKREAVGSASDASRRADGGAWGRGTVQDDAPGHPGRISDPGEIGAHRTLDGDEFDQFKDRKDVQDLRKEFDDIGFEVTDDDLRKVLEKSGSAEAAAKRLKEGLGEAKRTREILEEFGEAQTPGRSQVRDPEVSGQARSSEERDALEALGFDVADARKKPSPGQQPRHFQVGNFAHDNAEDLIPELPKGLKKEYEIRDYLSLGNEYKSYRADRVDMSNPNAPVVYEIKPKGKKNRAKGEEQGRLYAMLLDEKLGLKPGTTKYKVLQYDADTALKVMKKIGLL